MNGRVFDVTTRERKRKYPPPSAREESRRISETLELKTAPIGHLEHDAEMTCWHRVAVCWIAWCFCIASGNQVQGDLMAKEIQVEPS